MGCGTSISENEVNKPSEVSYKSEQDIKTENPALKKIQSEKVVPNGKHKENMNESQKISQPKQQQSIQKIEEKMQEVMVPKTWTYLFGQSQGQRKIVKLSTQPLKFETVSSRASNPPATKYQPTEVILEESQQLFSSHLFSTTSHPPYNFMYVSYLSQSVIFLCGGVNYDFNVISNEAFLYRANNQEQIASGNNLMGVQFEKLALMRTKRYSHMGVIYNVGKLTYVFVCGGRTEGDIILQSCERYCVESNKWNDVAKMNIPRSTGFAIIFNTKIYVFGGYTSEGKRSKKIQRYNMSQDCWEVLNIKLHRGLETGLLFPSPKNNQILLLGGNVEYGALKSVIRLNFKDEEYVWDSDMKHERLLQKGLQLKEDNLLYVFGGDFQDSVEKYSFKDRTWKLVTNLSYESCISPDDVNSYSCVHDTININTEKIMQSPKKNQKVEGEQMEYKYIFGNDNYPCVFQLNVKKWVLKRKNVPMALRLRSLMTVIQVKDGKYFLAGGIDSYFEKASRSAYLYYPGTNKAIEVKKMTERKYDFGAASTDNFVYVFGGRVNKEGDILSSAQKYDLTENQWIDLPSMPRQRAGHKAIFVPEKGKILLIGGVDGYQSINEIDILDIETDTFTTLKNIIPIPLDIRGIHLGAISSQETKKQKKQDDFQFLNENEEQPQPSFQTKIEEFLSLHILNYNSLLKQYTLHGLDIGLEDAQSISASKQESKVVPFSLSFQHIHQGKKYIYLISDKGVFRCGTSVESQIVINLIQMLTLPIDKFCIS